MAFEAGHLTAAARSLFTQHNLHAHIPVSLSRDSHHPEGFQAKPLSRRYLWHRQERDGTIVQTTHERDNQERDDNCACNSLHRTVLVVLLIVQFLYSVLVRSVIVYVIFFTAFMFSL
uniref:Uncharacterized protein n=1 Tax=Acrobeloides nanus TaxID=290746 RepID=A0A914EJQ3_9BILA